jgi:hypothetical protein
MGRLSAKDRNRWINPQKSVKENQGFDIRFFQGITAHGPVEKEKPPPHKSPLLPENETSAHITGASGYASTKNRQ